MHNSPLFKTRAGFLTPLRIWLCPLKNYNPTQVQSQLHTYE